MKDQLYNTTLFVIRPGEKKYSQTVMTWFDSGMFNQEVSCDKWMESTKKFTLQIGT